MKVMFSMYDDISDCAAPKTLCDWVKNFRVKKMQMKRKLRSGGDLRVCAIMATALISAENQLRLKQQERLNRCLQFQSKFNEKLPKPNLNMNMSLNLNSNDIENENGSATRTTIFNTTAPIQNDMIMKEKEKEDHRRSIEICDLWRKELNGLDKFMRKMSSNSGNIHNYYSIIDESRKFDESAYGNEVNNNMHQRQSITVSS